MPTARVNRRRDPDAVHSQSRGGEGNTIRLGDSERARATESVAVPLGAQHDPPRTRRPQGTAPGTSAARLSRIPERCES